MPDGCCRAHEFYRTIRECLFVGGGFVECNVIGANQSEFVKVGIGVTPTTPLIGPNSMSEHFR